MVSQYEDNSSVRGRKNVEMEATTEHDPGAIRLTDDGELTNSMVEEFEDEQRRARN